MARAPDGEPEGGARPQILRARESAENRAPRAAAFAMAIPLIVKCRRAHDPAVLPSEKSLPVQREQVSISDVAFAGPSRGMASGGLVGTFAEGDEGIPEEQRFAEEQRLQQEILVHGDLEALIGPADGAEEIRPKQSTRLFLGAEPQQSVFSQDASGRHRRAALGESLDGASGFIDKGQVSPEEEGVRVLGAGAEQACESTGQ